MNERPLPETIRGSWYLISRKSKMRKPVEKPLQIFRFRLDSSFSRYILGGTGAWTEDEIGDYTFDGGFLITRGKATEAYRVKRFSFWKWELEGNKYFSDLLRANIKEKDIELLSEEDLKEIRILPIRVIVKTIVKNEAEAIFDLFYSHEGKEIQVGSFFTTKESANRFSIGLSPLNNQISPQMWERILRESYLDMFLGKPDDIGVVTIRFLNDTETNPRIFSYP